MAEQFEGKIFDGRNNKNYEEDCKSYLLGLPTANLPFDCTNLRVLYEAVKLIHTYTKPTLYQSGTLICLRNVKVGLDRRCKINSGLESDAEGNLLFKCTNEEGRREFVGRLVNFQEFRM